MRSAPPPGEKVQFDIVMKTNSNTQYSWLAFCVFNLTYIFFGGGGRVRGLANFKSTFRGVMPFFSFPLKGSRRFVVLSDGSYQPTPWHK